MNIIDRKRIIKEHKKKGGLVAAVFPIHYPKAILNSFNILPIEIWGPSNIKSDYWVQHIQPYICSIVKNGISFLSETAIDLIDLIVVPHTCDSLQGLGSLLMDLNLKQKPVVSFYMPKGRRNSDKDFLINEFSKIYRTLSKITGLKPDDDEIMANILLEEELNELSLNICENRCYIHVNETEFYFLMNSRQYLYAKEFKKILLNLKNRIKNEEVDGVAVLLSGILPEPLTILESINSFNGYSAFNDLACLSRRFYPKGNSKKPLNRLADSFINGPPDSTRADTIKLRINYLLNCIKKYKVKGVIFNNIKFCEPELFYFPYIFKVLKSNNIPYTYLELELNDKSFNQIETRLCAFGELLK